MPVINATIDGVAVEIEEGCTGLQHYASRSDVVAMTVDGKAWDLSREIPSGATVEAITLNSPAGLEILRHSTRHGSGGSGSVPGRESWNRPLHHRWFLL